MKPRSLRTALTLWSAFVTGFALLTFSGGASISFYFVQIRLTDRRLADEAREIMAEPAGMVRRELDALLISEPRLIAGVAYHDAVQNIVLSRLAPVEALLKDAPPPMRFSHAHVGSKRLRLGSFREGDRTLVIAADLWPAVDPVFDLLASFLLALPVVLLVVGAGSWWLARRALRPITEISRAAASITAEQLGARLRQPEVEDEIGQHVRVLNAMFDRLERSFAQSARFAADASHELRTPLTILRGEIEEALRTGGFKSEQERLLLSLLEQTAGLQKIAENLLLLARFDAGKAPLEFVDTDLSALGRDLVEDAELLGADSNIRVIPSIAAGITLRADKIMMRRVMHNLIDNAIRYNHRGGEVQLRLTQDANGIRFAVKNTGPGIPEREQTKLFQRFFHLEEGDHRNGGGSGLGLSICREIVTAHGGTICLAASNDEWTEFVVLFGIPRTS